MCGIFGLLSRSANISVEHLNLNLLGHRGPDNFGVFRSKSDNVYLSHNRLSIIGLDDSSSQPMHGANGVVIVFNGEIYNYRDLKKSELASHQFKTSSDTEVILVLYEKYGLNCINYLRGMFAFAIWDGNRKRLFCARDRFGIKPFYYINKNDCFAFASEIKAILPFLSEIKTNNRALGEYLTFQYTIGNETLFQDVYQLMPGHSLILENNHLVIKKYWDISYQIDYDHSAKFFEDKLYQLLTESIQYHLISEVPIGSYLSGGIDSSLITILAGEKDDKFYGSFHGRFTEKSSYDESVYAQEIAKVSNKNVFIIDISAEDFIDNIQKIIYHLDVPVAGPGSFPQYMVSKLASQHVKVVLGGQGGDEIFGGYARYVIAYFEQAIKAAIDGTYKNGNFVVTPESIIPNLTLLQEYKPLIKEFWRDGLFDSIDDRYFRLIDKSIDFNEEIDWRLFDKAALLERFKEIFNSRQNVSKDAYFDKMAHFDFKCLLPSLLQVEDRMSMAHGLESRVPFLDHKLVEFAITIPADIKFPGGKMKSLLKKVFKDKIPSAVLNRRDKMGFPVPLKEWFSGPLKDFIHDIFTSQIAKTRGFYDPDKVLKNLSGSSQFSRKIWGLLSLELWYRQFHDKKNNVLNL
ncbi:MAG: asparagine synthase (glutamine-hydrolyzing) [Coxiellaceae bacterium]|jgi:asparagine synthase (glutamine-hydrolysing)|nr:asparagine synthase (glutamine-hydrolyzing) [Coxiellaceae bacterium]